jgi:hypothetical protein
MVLRKYLQRATVFMLFLLIFGHTPFLNASDPQSVSRITVEDVKQLLGKPDTVIIDVRKPRSWWRTSKKILSAVREDPSKVDQWARKYTKDQTLIFYCT